MENKGIFETVLATNKEYIDAINSNADAKVQVNLLKQCEIVLKTMIIDAGLAQEYKDYCDTQIAINGKLF